ncbi:ABC transporter ATP-binding protein [Rummeliibacillus sp. TYF005]|uniref:ABC transporter ATP-binding protein n=1 Tax=Rummeliibacillus sp. TYF005 TaxID=2058214 RepID=UPI000F53E9B6|nr:ABC transporter ATP-binding protein [Rummeliibacillus sp. TYF005]RPJ95167.1 ABC transporter ATP-binding protein [Rummeliibacillus sp. TYF005]
MIVEGKNLVKKYSEDQGIDNVSFTLQEGRIIALAGGNGAGKSTLIRLLIGEEKPDNGKLTWATHPSIRYMPDDVNFPPTLTALEILQLLAGLKKIPSSEIDRVLKRVGLWEYRKQRVRQFSKGMRQRINLAQALLGDEQLLILDEPTNGLDIRWIAELKTILQEQKDCGKTILFSTHLLSFAEELADDVLLLHEGHVLKHGNIKSVLQDSKTLHLEELFMHEIIQK